MSLQERIDSLIGLLDATGVTVEELRQENEALHLKWYESKACQCGYDDVCEFARERDELAAQVRTEQLYNQERGDMVAALAVNNKELLYQRFDLMGQVSTRNAALKECAEKFSYYEQHHVDKGDQTKALINRAMAVMCWSAIAAEKGMK